MNLYSKITSFVIPVVVLLNLIGSFSTSVLFAQTIDYGLQIKALCKVLLKKA